MRSAALVLSFIAVASCSPAATTQPTSSTPASTATSSATQVATTSTASSIADASTGDAGWSVIVDLSAPLPNDPIPEQEQVLTLVVGPHLQSAANCGDGGGSGGGKSVASLGGALSGAFTKKGATEKAYVVNVQPCGGDATHRFVVIAANKIVLTAPVREHTIFSVHDLDGDGVNEILLLGTSSAVLADGGHAKEAGTDARLYSAEDGQLQELCYFGIVHSGSCQYARILYRRQGTGVDYHTDRERMATCR